MKLSKGAPLTTVDPMGARVPWFFRRNCFSDMHHIEIVTRLEGEHFEPLSELTEAASRADGHEPIGEHKFLRLQHGDDLAIAFLAQESDQLVGYAHTLTYGTGDDRRVSCELVVHPEVRRSGIGRTLLDYVIRHAESEGARRLDLWAYNDSDASRAIAGGFGMKATRRLLHMHRHPGPPPQPAHPDGVTIRPFKAGEDEMWLELNNHVFAGHPEQGNWTQEDFRARTAQEWFRPEDLLVLEVDGAPAGFCWTKVENRGDEGSVGEIYVIGTDPAQHGKGLGRYLLGEGLRHLSEREVRTVAVYVDESNERAIVLYESFDFHHHHADVMYSLPLPVESRRKIALGS